MKLDSAIRRVIQRLEREKTGAGKRIPNLVIIWGTDEEVEGPEGDKFREIVAIPNPELTAVEDPAQLREFLLQGDGAPYHWDAVKLLPKKMRTELLPQREFLMRDDEGTSPKQRQRNAEILSEKP